MKRKEFLAKKHAEKKPQMFHAPVYVAWIEGYETARAEAAQMIFDSSWKSLSERVKKLGEEIVDDEPKKPWRVDG